VRAFSIREEGLRVRVDKDRYSEVIKNMAARTAVSLAMGPPAEGANNPLLPPPKMFASPAPLPTWRRIIAINPKHTKT